MKFNGTTVPTHRDDTYTTQETNRDIQTGRAVYADKDKYENDEAYKASIDSYVKEGFHLIFGTPDNPSEGSGGGSDVGYECTEEWVTLTEESVTTASTPFGDISGALSYQDPITANTIKVTLDGNEYVLNATILTVPGGVSYQYGGEGYAFTLDSYVGEPAPIGGRNSLITETAGTYSIKIDVVGETVETTPCFEKAVKSVVPEPSMVQLINGVTTKAEIAKAYVDGKLMYCIDYNGHYHIVEYPNLNNSFAFSVFPTDAGLLFGLDENLQHFAIKKNIS